MCQMFGSSDLRRGTSCKNDNAISVHEQTTSVLMMPLAIYPCFCVTLFTRTQSR